MRRLGEIGYWIVAALLALMTLVGLLALRRTIRALRQPDGHAMMGSLTALVAPALPMWFIIPIIDDEPQWRVQVALGAVMLYSLFVCVCFVLSVVRWVRTARSVR